MHDCHMPGLGGGKRRKTRNPGHAQPASLAGALFLVPCISVAAKGIQGERRGQHSGWSPASGDNTEIGGTRSSFMLTTAKETLSVVMTWAPHIDMSFGPVFTHYVSIVYLPA